ncbi:MAG: BrnT family toxin [Anaerovoracaceae bacterium]
MLKFEWDDIKNEVNIRKHKISFAEATKVFWDNNSILFDDPEHSEYEERFLIIGITTSEKVCIVCHCYREDDDVIRIISARKATKFESVKYFRNLGGY